MLFISFLCLEIEKSEKVNFRSQILVHPSIGEYWNTFGVPVLPENVIFTFFRMCWCYSEAYNTGTPKWFSIVQYSCTSIWDFKYTVSEKSFFSHFFWVLSIVFLCLSSLLRNREVFFFILMLSIVFSLFRFSV